MRCPLLQRFIVNTRTLAIEDYIQTIKEDVEALLNAFCAECYWDPAYSELEHSLLNFGMRNYLKRNYSSVSNHAHLCQEIKTLIESKEPRLKKLHVQAFDETENSQLIIYIRIDAQVNVGAQEKSVVLASQLNPLTMSFKLL